MPEQSEPISVELTVIELRAVRMALIFGVPDPEPPELSSARSKMAEAEWAATHA